MERASVDERALVDEVLALALHLIAAAAPAHGIGIRWRGRKRSGGDAAPFPLACQVGFSDRFVREARRCYYAADATQTILTCLCGAVLEGRGDRVALTPGGCHWEAALDAEKLAAASVARETRSACLDEGIASLMLVPLRDVGDVLGLVQVADRRPGAFDLGTLGKLEKIAAGLARLLGKIDDLAMARGSRGAAAFHVLVAEDDVRVNAVMKRLLLRAGYRCTTAGDGLEAYELLQAQRFDLLVTDLEMPGMNGVELIEKIRARYGPYGPPVIVCSGSAELAGLDAAGLRIAARLTKPFASLRELQEVVARVLLD